MWGALEGGDGVEDRRDSPGSGVGLGEGAEQGREEAECRQGHHGPGIRPPPLAYYRQCVRTESEVWDAFPAPSSSHIRVCL